MQTVTPGASHLEVTPIAYGTWQFGDDWRSHSPGFTGPGIRRNLEVVAAPGRSAADRGATTAQLAVAWVLAHPAVQVPSSARAPRPISRKASAPSISP